MTGQLLIYKDDVVIWAGRKDVLWLWKQGTESLAYNNIDDERQCPRPSDTTMKLLTQPKLIRRAEGLGCWDSSLPKWLSLLL